MPIFLRLSPAVFFLTLPFCSLVYAADPASQPVPVENPLEWIPAGTNLVIQGCQLDRWLGQPWMPSLFEVMDSIAKGQDTPAPAWCKEMFGAGPPADREKRRAAFQALRTLLSGRVTMTAALSAQRVDGVTVFELPALSSARADPSALDPRWAALPSALGWQVRGKDPAKPLYYWPLFNALVSLRGNTALVAQANSVLAKRMMQMGNWIAPAGARPAAPTGPLRVTDQPTFQTMFRPAEPGEISGFYQPTEVTGDPTISGVFLTVLSGAGQARVQDNRLLLDVKLRLTPAAVRALNSRPILLGLAGPGRRVAPGPLSQPASRPTSRPAYERATTQPWNEVSGTLAVWQGPMFFPRQTEEWMQITPLAAQLILTLEAISPGLSVQRDLLDELGEQVVLVWGKSSIEQDQEVGGLAYPCLAVGLALRDTDRLRRLLDILPRVINPLLAVWGPKPPVTVNRIDLEPTLYSVPFGRLLSGMLNRSMPGNLRMMLERLELVWGLKNGWLVLGTDFDLVRRCLLAQGHHPGGNKVVLRRDTLESLNFRIHASESGKTLGDWLDYLAKMWPDTMTDEWWKKQLEGPVPHPPRIGAIVQVLAPPAQPSSAPAGLLEVVAVFPGTPADGVLEIGDRIWAINDKPLDPKRPRTDLAKQIYDSKSTGPISIKLSLYRGGRLLDLALPLPPAPDLGGNPLTQLRLWSRVFDCIQEFNYAQHLTDGLLGVQAEIVWKR